LYGIRRVLRRRFDRLSVTTRTRLHTGLPAGDPGGEITLAWALAQDLMALYQPHDPALARRPAERLIAGLRSCPIDELARLGRTLPTTQPRTNRPRSLDITDPHPPSQVRGAEP
jgi:hypothetical protein